MPENTVQNMGTLFPHELVTDLYSKVKGRSTIAKLSKQEPIPFTGTDMFTFTLDKEVDIVAESGKKSHGGITLAPVSVVPIKIEYGARVSDEFMYATQERKIEIIKNFNEGFAKKAARGVDIIGFHGVNPRTGQLSAVVTSHMDQVTNTVEYTSATPDTTLETAITMLGENDATGYAFSKTFGSDMGKVKTTDGMPLYPEFRFGGNPGAFNGIQADVNSTVSAYGNDIAIIGDFQNAIKRGYAKNVTFEVIPYGDPDNSGVDLKGSNQVYLRCETYIGFAVIDKDAFVRIIQPSE